MYVYPCVCLHVCLCMCVYMCVYMCVFTCVFSSVREYQNGSLCSACHSECRPINGSASCHGPVRPVPVCGCVQLPFSWFMSTFNPPPPSPSPGAPPVCGVCAPAGRGSVCVALPQRGEGGAGHRLEVQQRQRALSVLQHQLHTLVRRTANTHTHTHTKTGKQPHKHTR